MERRVENLFGESVDLRRQPLRGGTRLRRRAMCRVPRQKRRVGRIPDIAGQTWYAGDGCQPQANPCDSSKLRAGLCRKVRLAETREDDPGQTRACALIRPMSALSHERT